MKLQKGDLVKIIKGKDKGKSGKIEKVFSKENKVLINDVNQYKRHFKARSGREKSEIITLTKPLPLSNVALICPNCKKETRVGFKIDKNDKLRICKKCKKAV